MARGQKICPKCKAATGPRTAKCECGYVWFEKRTSVVNPNPSGQRGKKRCPECDELVGVRSRECICGYSFEKKPEKQEVLELHEFQDDNITVAIAEEPKQTFKRNGFRKLFAAAGPCPVKLIDFTPEGVEIWRDKVIENGINNKIEYLPNAIRLFLQQFVSPNSNEYKNLKQYCEKELEEMVA